MTHASTTHHGRPRHPVALAKLTCLVPTDTLDQLHTRARETDRSLASIVRKALRAELAHQEAA